MSLLRRGFWVLCVLGLMLATRQLRVQAFTKHQRTQRYSDRYYLPSAGWLPVLSLGYRQALADLIWCRSLVYFGQDIGHSGEVKYAFDYTDAILAVDPDFRAAYRWIATAAFYRRVAADTETGLRAASYLERAVQRWPRDGELRWDYGSTLRFELVPIVSDKRQKQVLLERAAPHLEAAARLGAGPPWLGLNSASLLSKLGRTEQAIRHLEELYGTVQDERTREEIEQRLATLRSHSYSVALRAAHEQFAHEHAESYPYLSPGLFLFVGVRGTLDEYDLLLASGFLWPPPVEEAGEATD